jgi:hypothetical protein
MSDKPHIVGDSPNHPRIKLPEGPRTVRGIRICQAEPLEPGWYGELGIVIAAEDRTRLLLEVATAIANVPSAVINGGFGHVINGHAFLNFVVATPLGGPDALRGVAANVNALKGRSVEGQQYLIDQFKTIIVSAPARPGLLRDACRIMADYKMNIRQFDMTTRLEIPQDATPFDALNVATTHIDLTFRTEMPRQTVSDLPACLDMIRALSPPGTITCT